MDFARARRSGLMGGDAALKASNAASRDVHEAIEVNRRSKGRGMKGRRLPHILGRAGTMPSCLGHLFLHLALAILYIRPSAICVTEARNTMNRSLFDACDQSTQYSLGAFNGENDVDGYLSRPKDHKHMTGLCRIIGQLFRLCQSLGCFPTFEKSRSHVMKER